MAFNPAPNAWLDGVSEDGTDITLPIASLPELTAAEADGVTGDIRKFLYALCAKAEAEFAERAAADQPTKMTIGKSSSLNPANNQITIQFAFVFVLAPTGLDVTAEA